MFDRFSHVMVWAPDVARAAAWYAKHLGFEARLTSPHYAILDHPATGLRVDVHPVEAGSEHLGRGPLPYLASARFDELIAELRAGGVEVDEPRSEGGSPRFTAFKDCEGNVWGLSELPEG